MLCLNPWATFFSVPSVDALIIWKMFCLRPKYGVNLAHQSWHVFSFFFFFLSSLLCSHSVLIQVLQQLQHLKSSNPAIGPSPPRLGHCTQDKGTRSVKIQHLLDQGDCVVGHSQSQNNFWNCVYRQWDFKTLAYSRKPWISVLCKQQLGHSLPLIQCD